MAVYPDYDGWLACGDCHLQLTRDIVIVQQLEEMLMAHAPSCGVEGG